MLLFAIVVLIAIGGSQCHAETCSGDIGTKCSLQFPFPYEFPETKEDLDTMCRSVAAIANCVFDATENCVGGDYRFDRHVIKGIGNYLEETCTLENNVYNGILKNLKCLKTNMDKVEYECDILKINDARKKVMEAYAEELNATGVNEDCMNGAWGAACSAVTFGDICGTDARDAVLDFITHFDYTIAHNCPEDVTAKFPEFVEALSSAEKEAEILMDETLLKILK